MRKLVAIISLALLSFVSVVHAADFSPSVIIDKVKSSLVRVRTKRENVLTKTTVTAHSGSGFVVEATPEQTVVCTAKHVIDDAQAAFCVIVINDTEIRATEVKKIDCTDAAYLVFKPGIQGVKALEFNLLPNDDVIDAIAIGFAQNIHLRDCQPTPTFTVGSMLRKVAERLPYDDKVATGIIYGTPTLLFGYSGGPCVDLEYRLLGINVAIGREMTMFVDSRTLWNNLPMLNKGKKVLVPFDPAFHVTNSLGKKRIPITKGATITQKDGTFQLEEYVNNIFKGVVKEIDVTSMALSVLMGMPATMPNKAKDWATTNTYFTIDGKSYVIYYIEISVSNCQSYRNRITFREEEKRYIFMCDDGWQVAIELDQVDDKVITGIKDAWKLEATKSATPAIKPQETPKPIKK